MSVPLPQSKWHAKRMELLGTEMAFQVLGQARELEKQGKSIIHLQIGEPDFTTPKHIIDAGIKALANGDTHYTPSSGRWEMRVAVANHVTQKRKVHVPPEQVVITPGGKPVMFFVMLACIQEGDEVIYPNPGYPIYESMIKFSGGTPVPLPLLEEKEFAFDVDTLKSLITPKTRMIILNTPHNPTGGVLQRNELEAVAELAKKHNLLVLTDEIYDEIVYGDEVASILSLPGMLERTVLLGGHSKNYAMTGWRLGYAVVPRDLFPAMERLMINANSCTASFTQAAGIAALEGPQAPVHEMVAVYNQRRDVMVERLNAMGLRCRSPRGAFYVFPCAKPEVTGLPITSAQMQHFFLHECGVAVLDGAAFGKYGNGYIRLSYVSSLEKINEGLDRMQKGLEKLRAAVKAGNLEAALGSAAHVGAGGVVTTQTPASGLGDDSIVQHAGLSWKVFGAENKKWRILVTKNMPGPHKWCQRLLVANGCRVEVCQSNAILTKAQISAAIQAMPACDAVIGQLTEKWDGELFDVLKAQGGRAYSNMAVGFDNVDVPAATQRGMPVGNTPGVLTETTAEMAVALTFAAARKVVDADRFLREGKFKGWLPSMFVGNMLHQKTVGIIGAGRIGAAYARMMIEGHKMNLIYYDVIQNKQLEDFVTDYSQFLTKRGEQGVTVTRISTVEQVFQQADVLSLHTLLDASTRGLVNRERLALMKDNAILINTSRGPVIDEEQLAEHCASHPDFLVGLDVFEKEPQVNPRLLALPNLVLVPHIASATVFTRTGMAILAASNVLGVLEAWPAWQSPDVTPFVQGDAESWQPPHAVPSIVNRKDLPNAIFAKSRV